MRRTLRAIAFAFASMLQLSGCLAFADPVIVCHDESDCASSERCRASRCVPRDYCTSRSECAGGELCLNDRCTSVECFAVQDDGCAPYLCSLGDYVCETECDRDDDCATGFICEDAACVARECTSKADCNDLACTAGRCAESCDTDTNDGCPPSLVCVDGERCAAPAGALCRESSDCARGSCCGRVDGAMSCVDADACPLWATCEADADCESATCLPVMGSDLEVCSTPCADDDACAAGERCLQAQCGEASCPARCWPTCNDFPSTLDPSPTCSGILGGPFACEMRQFSLTPTVPSVCVSQCSTQSECAHGTCAFGGCELGREGDACDRHDDCALHRCVDGACIDARVDGQVCESNARCYSNTCCLANDVFSSNTCRPAATQCLAVIGQTCTSDAECISGECSSPPDGIGFCTRACEDDGDCEEPEGYANRCHAQGDAPSRCLRTCTTESDCHVGSTFSVAFECSADQVCVPL